MNPVSVETALVELYNATRKAPLPVIEHDNNRGYVEMLARALNLNIAWVQPEAEVKAPEPEVLMEVIPNKVSATNFKHKKIT